MKIQLHTFFPQEIRECLGRDPFVTSKIDLSSRVWIDAPSELLDRVLLTLELFKPDRLGPVPFVGYVEFTKSEMAATEFFRLLPRSAELGLSFEEFRRTTDELEQSPWLVKSPGWRVRLLERVFVSRPKMRPNVVSNLSEGLDDFVVPQDVLDRPGLPFQNYVRADVVVHPKTQSPHHELYLLRAGDFMPPVHRNDHYNERTMDNGKLRMPAVRGNLCYDLSLVRKKTDLLYTAEPFGSWYGTPALVCSNGFRVAVIEAKVKGFAFQPIIDTNSKLYGDYMKRWKQIIDQVSGDFGLEII